MADDQQPPGPPESSPVTSPESQPVATHTTQPPARSIWRRGGPIWAWPVVGVGLIAVASQLAGRIGALLVAGMGIATLILLGSELASQGRRKLFGAGLSFVVAGFIVIVALYQPAPTSTTGSPTTTTASGSARPAQPAQSAPSALAPPPDLRGRTVTADMLAGKNLQGIDLRGSTLRGLDLRGQSLDGALLTGASLIESRLDGASLRGADLQGADLRRVCLRRVDLRGAILIGADADGADVRDAQLSPGATTTADRWPAAEVQPDPALCA